MSLLRKPLPTRSRSLSLAAAGVALVLGASACSAPAGGAANDDGKLAVVTSTSAYGSIVQAIGGDKVSVESIVSKISQDPHSYEATAQDRLKVSKAKLVVVNGGGYDAFMDGMVRDAKLDPANLLTAADISGLESSTPESTPSSADGHDHGSFNEHVWYSFPAMEKVATSVEQRLSALAPASAAEFKHNADAFRERLAGLQGTVTALANGKHLNVAITEPVPLYLLEAAGLHNVTPEQFTSAVEEGHDVSATVLDQTRKLFSSKQAALLAYNDQTSGPQTEAVRAAATAAGVPVLDFTETLPDGKDYLGWMTDNVTALQQALTKLQG
ncbi:MULTISPECIES: zinc ABC transporter substrate-binding protein [Arthrobacter]|uniref:Zinc ABC transporter substrate-binding protein n=2 Tax=Arthrobacter TaxID=1663 RepID=A0ABU9KNH8_9MICC|nr:zinc ABC transporter substrate-binding protein [Arthrobacter sp. YJM1]MDP5228422.1 zinc ABC transporter substrate-binding protein [Arthrobacter sp. YJM1]